MLFRSQPSWSFSGGSETDISASQGSGASNSNADESTRAKQNLATLHSSTPPDPDTATKTAWHSGEQHFFFCGIHSNSLTEDTATEHLTNDATPESVSPHVTWPAHTNLVFHRGKLLLTNQHPIVRVVITSAIENLKAAMLFNNAFPDVCSALTLIKDCLFTAANCLKPGSASILEQLENDATYLLEIMPLVSLIHSETIALTILFSHMQGSP